MTPHSAHPHASLSLSTAFRMTASSNHVWTAGTQPNGITTNVGPPSLPATTIVVCYDRRHSTEYGVESNSVTPPLPLHSSIAQRVCVPNACNMFNATSTVAQCISTMTMSSFDTPTATHAPPLTLPLTPSHQYNYFTTGHHNTASMRALEATGAVVCGSRPKLLANRRAPLKAAATGGRVPDMRALRGWVLSLSTVVDLCECSHVHYRNSFMLPQLE